MYTANFDKAVPNENLVSCPDIDFIINFIDSKVPGGPSVLSHVRMYIIISYLIIISNYKSFRYKTT